MYMYLIFNLQSPEVRRILIFRFVIIVATNQKIVYRVIVEFILCIEKRIIAYPLAYIFIFYIYECP